MKILLFCFIYCTLNYSFGVPLLPNGGKIWALLVAGSSTFNNYRHQADVCHAYQILHGNGIPDEQIIVMMFDDVAFAQDNPTPGKIINVPGGPDVYKGVPKDYTGSNVNPTVFLNVLTGNSSAVEGIGSGKVIKSGPNDHIFVNFVDHGGPGILYFPEDSLPADDLVSTLNFMSKKKMFNKMVLYIEACYSGSMFDDLLDDDLNVFVTTAADPHESSFACFWDDTRNTYLADVFSAVWLNNSIHEGNYEDLHHLYEKVRTLTNTSHVEEYGDLDIGNTKLRDFIGSRMTSNSPQNRILIKENDVADNIDVELMTLSKKYKHEKDIKMKSKLKQKIRKLNKIYSTIDDIFDKLINTVVKDPIQKSKILTTRHTLGRKNFQCYKQMHEKFSDRCLKITKNTYARKHLYKFVNMCAMANIKTEDILRGIVQSCEAPMQFTY